MTEEAQLIRRILTWTLAIAQYERRTSDEILNTPGSESVKIIIEAHWESQQLTVEQVRDALATLPE